MSKLTVDRSYSAERKTLNSLEAGDIFVFSNSDVPCIKISRDGVGNEWVNLITGVSSSPISRFEANEVVTLLENPVISYTV